MREIEIAEKRRKEFIAQERQDSLKQTKDNNKRKK